MSIFPVKTCPQCTVALVHTEQGLVCARCQIYRGRADRLWLQLLDSAPAGFDHSAVARLADLGEQEHFWMRERRRLIALLLRRMQGAVGRGWANALELGCGAGLMLPILEACAERVVAMDGHRSLLQRAQAASKRTIVLQGDITKTRLQNSAFDLITAFDVLEHVDADAFLSEMRRLAHDDGKLLISVPAFSALWSEMDVRAGHRCRYRWSQLKTELKRNGWRMMGYTHFQFLLFPMVYVSRRISKFAPQGLERRPPRGLDRMLGMINSLEVTLFHGVSLPFGSSLFAWACVDR